MESRVLVLRYLEGGEKNFSKFHYMSSDLHKAARCFALFVGDKSVAFAGALHRPHPKADDIMGVSRLVTLPDWQGLGLSFVLVDAIGAAYKKIGKRLHMYPAHPGLIRSYDRSPTWALVAKPGLNGYSKIGSSSSLGRGKDMAMGSSGRPSATFRYVGPAMLSTEEAIRFIEGRPIALCPPRSPRAPPGARPS
jgi:GNAT superfamily N-acetyltransferase